jgi:hypothetical protein
MTLETTASSYVLSLTISNIKTVVYEHLRKKNYNHLSKFITFYGNGVIKLDVLQNKPTN